MPPAALIQTLQDVRRRVRILSVLYGVGVVIAAAVALLLAVLVLDYLLNLPPIPRIIFMLAAVVGLGYVLARWVVRPALSRLGLSDLAGKLETAFPDFDDRLRSTVDFLTKGIPGSDSMKDRVAAEAAELAGRFNLNSAVQTKPVYQSFAAASGMIAMMVLLGVLLGSEYLKPAFWRLFTPFNAIPWPKRVIIESMGKLPQSVPAGGHVDVRMHLIKGDSASREARVFVKYGNGPEQTEIMTRGADGIYSASLDARADAGGLMTVWMEAGDDETNQQPITIVKPLSISHVELQVTPPAYTKEAAYSLPIETAPATITYGSDLALKVIFSKDIDAGKLLTLIPGQDSPAVPTAKWDGISGGTATAHWVAKQNTSFQIRATDLDGYSNSDASEYQVIVRPDLTPQIQITAPARNEECTPQATLQLQAVAEDDYAISNVKLFIIKMGDKPQPYSPVDLVINGAAAPGVKMTRLEASGDRRRWQIDYPWDLAHVDSALLKPGDVLEYHLEASDNYDFEGQTHDAVSSGRYRISIMSQEQFTALMNDLVGQVASELVQIRNNQASIKEETGDLAHETQKQPQFNNADRAEAQDLQNRQSTAAAQSKQSASKLSDIKSRMDENKSEAVDLQKMVQNVSDDLNRVAEQPMKNAGAGLEDAKNQKADPSDSPAKTQARADARNAELASVQQDQQDAQTKLDDLIDKLGDVGGLPKAVSDLKNILAQQQANSAKSDALGMKNLGKRPDQMSDDDKNAQKNNADDQKNLADKTQKAIDQMKAQAGKLSKSDPTSSQALSQAAQTGDEQAVPSQMQNSAQAQQQNQQSAAQQAQSKAELGLQMMLRQLEEAERRKLEELAKQLAQMQDQIRQLIREQSGLNYDNMALRGADVVAKADQKVIADLIQYSDRDKTKLPPPMDLTLQNRTQEQTERNSRSVAKAAEPLPEGAAIAAALNRAADRMGRAITFLRDDTQTDNQRLAGAYDPPQVDALAALLKAKQTVDEQAAKANTALAQQQKDAIRAIYEKILAAQKVVDTDTKTIDKAPRGDDGQLGHANATRLAQLPAEQNGLAEKVAALDDNLSAMGGLVYVWANKDITDSMRAVHDQLAKPETGVATQAEQTRIEDQLQAMIESLMVKPKQSDFASQQQGGGGGGQGGGPQLPSEAELRLMKQLQTAVNKSTKTIADSAKPDESTLTSLGVRQGDLRSLLDQTLQKASQGKLKLGPEPDPTEKLPEEASVDQLDLTELQHQLLNTNTQQPDPQGITKDVDEVGQRMSRSKVRLGADHDPGKMTQEIQDRILANMDALIELSRAQLVRSNSPPQPGSPQAQAQTPANSPGNSQQGQQQQNNTGSTPATVSMPGKNTDGSNAATADITQTQKEWGSLPQRARQAVIEAESEKPVEKYKQFIDDYYKALGAQAGQ